jgi:tetratricopeptide (TPR) repeat protein
MALTEQRVEDELQALLAFRGHDDWRGLVRAIAVLPPELRSHWKVQQQLGLALNRAGSSEEAEGVLRRLLDGPGDHSKTYGILGRIYKDRWQTAHRPQDLEKSIDAYVRGFEANPRNPYPGINALTLMTIRDEHDPAIATFSERVRAAVEGRQRSADYFDSATRLELAVVMKESNSIDALLGDARRRGREPWQLETTANNLRLLRDARETAGDSANMEREVEQQLARAAERLRALSRTS